MKNMFITVSTEYDIELIEALAREIWTEHYVPIIGKEQVDYMLAEFQSRQAIGEQIRFGTRYFLIKEDDSFIGYIAIKPRGRELFLSKIYIKSSRRGMGYGKKAVEFAEKMAKELDLDKIVLTVNKNNVNSIMAYEKIGFKNVGSVIQDIGNGFFMDDYKMEKIL